MSDNRWEPVPVEEIMMWLNDIKTSGCLSDVDANELLGEILEEEYKSGTLIKVDGLLWRLK